MVEIGGSLKKDRFVELYQEGIKRKERKEKLNSLAIEEECTFQPKLVTKKRQSSRGGDGGMNKSSVDYNSMSPIRIMQSSQSNQ